MEKGLTYPTRNGIPVPVDELHLPESKLNVEKRRNLNNHHSCWPASRFGKCVLLNTLRNLESQQKKIPKDVHLYLHDTYEPPELPTPLQALTEIQRAAKAGEELNIRYKCIHIRKKIGEEVMKQVVQNYNKLRDGKYNWKKFKYQDKKEI